MVVSHSLLCVVFSHFENYAQAPPNARPKKYGVEIWAYWKPI